MQATELNIPEGYEKLPVNVNQGGTNTADKVFLYFKRDPHGSAITNFAVIDDTSSVPDGFRAIGAHFCCYVFPSSSLSSS